MGRGKGELWGVDRGVLGLLDPSQLCASSHWDAGGPWDAQGCSSRTHRWGFWHIPASVRGVGLWDCSARWQCSDCTQEWSYCSQPGAEVMFCLDESTAQKCLLCELTGSDVQLRARLGLAAGGLGRGGEHPQCPPLNLHGGGITNTVCRCLAARQSRAQAEPGPRPGGCLGSCAAAGL